SRSTGARSCGSRTAAFSQRRNHGVERSARHNILPPLFRPEEKRLGLAAVVMAGNEDRATQREAVIVFLVFRGAGLEFLLGVVSIVAVELIDIAVKAAGAGLGLDFHRTGAILAVLRPVVRGKHTELG